MNLNSLSNSLLNENLSYLGPGCGVGPSDWADEEGGGGGVVAGGEVSMGWAEGEGVEVVDEDEGGGGAAAAEVVSVWEVWESAERPWNRSRSAGSTFLDQADICSAA